MQQVNTKHNRSDITVKPRGKRIFGWILLLCLLIGGYIFWQQTKSKAATSVSNTDVPAIPVTTALVTKQDVPVYLTGLGTVQASQSVVLKARVDGQINMIAFKEGALVKEGDVIAQIDPRLFQAQLEQAQAQKLKNEALLTNAKADLARSSSLLKNEFASRQSVDAQKSLVAQYTAALQSDQAQINYQQTQLGYATIRSPISGITGARQIDVGNIVRASDTNGIVVVTQIEPISVLATVPQDALDSIRSAMKSSDLKLFAYGRTDTTPRAEGKLTLIDNQIDAATGSLHLKGTFENIDHALWPGQFVNVKLLIKTENNAITVPTAAIQRGQNGPYVYVLKKDETVEVRPVTSLRTLDGTAVIEKGLQEGESVVIEGQYRLKPGVKAKAQPLKTATSDEKTIDSKIMDAKR